MDAHVQELLRGSIDLHVHCDPSFMFRHNDAVGFSNDASAVGMRAICIKDHHLSAVQSAFFANKYRNPSDAPFDCFASMCLNHSSGGFDAYVLEMNLRFGAKQIYFPTISARTPVMPPKDAAAESNAGAFLPVKIAPPKEPPLYVLDDKGEVKQEALECIALIRDYDAILSTGHLDYEETYKVVKAAAELGCKKILLTHFDTVGLLYDGDRKRGFDEMKEIQALGDCFVEYTHTMTLGPLSTMEYHTAAIDFFGVERVCLGSDIGSMNFPPLVECWVDMLEKLVAYGYTDSQIRVMCEQNQRILLGLDDETE